MYDLTGKTVTKVKDIWTGLASAVIAFALLSKLALVVGFSAFGPVGSILALGLFWLAIEQSTQLNRIEWMAVIAPHDPDSRLRAKTTLLATGIMIIPATLFMSLSFVADLGFLGTLLLSCICVFSLFQGRLTLVLDGLFATLRFTALVLGFFVVALFGVDTTQSQGAPDAASQNIRE